MSCYFCVAIFISLSKILFIIQGALIECPRCYRGEYGGKSGRKKENKSYVQYILLMLSHLSINQLWGLDGTNSIYRLIS
jgi:hypothetical protein